MDKSLSYFIVYGLYFIKVFVGGKECSVWLVEKESEKYNEYNEGFGLIKL